jgi:delta-aminolevulinic acid dehydratase/porphobilinogen synthase
MSIPRQWLAPSHAVLMGQMSQMVGRAEPGEEALEGAPLLLVKPPLSLADVLDALAQHVPDSVARFRAALSAQDDASISSV